MTFLDDLKREIPDEDEEYEVFDPDPLDESAEEHDEDAEIFYELEMAYVALSQLQLRPPSAELAQEIQEQILPILVTAISWMPLENPELIRSRRRLETSVKVLEKAISLMRAKKEAKEAVSPVNSQPPISRGFTPPNEPTPMDCTSEGKSEEKLDSFSDGRRAAIEATLVTNPAELPLLSDIAGLEKAKEALFEALVDPIRYSEWFTNSDLHPWKCVLLYGPPGTGKSHLSKAIAREIDCRFYQVSSSDLISSWSGQSEKLVRGLFDHALAYENASVIFIDEVDSLCRVRSTNEDDANRRVKTELLVQLQRLHTSASRTLLICATNCPWELDPAFLRRFEKRIFIGLPEHEARRDLLDRLLKRTNRDVTVTSDWLAAKTEGYSGDDLRRLARELAFRLFRRFKSGSAFGLRNTLTKADVEEVLHSFVPTVSLESLERFEQFKT